MWSYARTDDPRWREPGQRDIRRGCTCGRCMLQSQWAVLHAVVSPAGAPLRRADPSVQPSATNTRPTATRSQDMAVAGRGDGPARRKIGPELAIEVSPGVV